MHIYIYIYMGSTLMFLQDDIQLVMYIRTNSFGSSTAVVSLFTTSMECRLMSMLTRTVKYLDGYTFACVCSQKKKLHMLERECRWECIEQKFHCFTKYILGNFRRIYQLGQDLNSNKRIVFHQFLKLRG